MKITICGKGGCGKSTVTSLLAKEFARMGKTVLVVDSDESNFGLHRQLGLELPRDFTEYFGGKDKAFKKMIAGEILDTVKLSTFAKKFFSQAFTISEIPQEYVAKKDGVMLISSGKIHRANEGCACTMNKILEQFVDHLTLSRHPTGSAGEVSGCGAVDCLRHEKMCRGRRGICTDGTDPALRRCGRVPFASR